MSGSGTVPKIPGAGHDADRALLPDLCQPDCIRTFDAVYSKGFTARQQPVRGVVSDDFSGPVHRAVDGGLAERRNQISRRFGGGEYRSGRGLDCPFGPPVADRHTVDHGLFGHDGRFSPAFGRGRHHGPGATTGLGQGPGHSSGGPAAQLCHRPFDRGSPDTGFDLASDPDVVGGDIHLLRAAIPGARQQRGPSRARG